MNQGSNTKLEKEALQVREFCFANGISRSLFYKLMSEGRAPRSFVVGRRRLISREAAAEWRKELEHAERDD